MERTNFVTKLISVLLFAAVFIYFCVYGYRYFANPYTTATAISYTVGDSYQAEGIIVRRESLFTTSEKYVSFVAEDGQKIAGGQTVASAYNSDEQRQIADQIAQLNLEIAQLEEYAQAEQQSLQAVSQDTTIKENVMELNRHLSKGDLDNIGENVVILRALVFSGDTGETQEKISSLESQVTSLRGQLSTQGTNLSLDEAGIFSTNVDGYEYLHPDTLSTIDAGDLTSVIAGNTKGEIEAIAKLATGIDWYFAALVPKDEAVLLKEIKDKSGSIDVKITGVSSDTINMTVERADTQSNDCVVVLKCNYSLGDSLSTRITEAEIIYDSVTGIRVAKNAVYQDEEGKYYIFTEKAMQAEQHYVDILLESDDYYLIESSDEDTSPIREGDKIIVNAKNLYDGKVIA